MFINIYSKGKYPADELSNFARHKFEFDGFEIPCMEALLQSLKFENIDEQRQILSLTAKEAKKAGNEKGWHTWLFWKGQRINRFSKEYYEFLLGAYRQMLHNNEFRQALADSKRKILLHTIGKTFRRNTVLTWWEFVKILSELRKEI